MTDWPVRENGLWILLTALWLWVVTFAILAAAVRNAVPSLAKGSVRKGLLGFALLLSIAVFGSAIFGSSWANSNHFVGLLAGVIAIALLTAFDRSGRVTLAVALPVWYATLIFLTLEGALGTFIVDPLVPNTERQFQEDVVDWWPYAIEEVKDPDTFRILALGDSFGRVHGENNYHFLVHRRFEEEGIDAEILNVSISAIEPIDQLKILRLFGLKYKPDLVLQNFFVGNDFYTPPGEFVSFGGIQVRHHKGFSGCRPENFLLVDWVRAQGMVLSDRASKQREAQTEEPIGTFSRDAFLRIEFDRLAQTCGKGLFTQRFLNAIFPIMDDIHQLGVDIGADHAMVILPDQFQIDNGLLQEVVSEYQLRIEDFDLELPQNKLRKYCRDRKIRVLDLLEPLREKGRNGDLFLLRDSHYNETGNALIAERLYRFLVENWNLRPTPQTAVGDRPTRSPN